MGQLGYRKLDVFDDVSDSIKEYFFLEKKIKSEVTAIRLSSVES